MAQTQEVQLQAHIFHKKLQLQDPSVSAPVRYKYLLAAQYFYIFVLSIAVLIKLLPSGQVKNNRVQNLELI